MAAYRRAVKAATKKSEWLKRQECANCGKKGHLAADCTKPCKVCGADHRMIYDRATRTARCPQQGTANPAMALAGMGMVQVAPGTWQQAQMAPPMAPPVAPPAAERLANVRTGVWLREAARGEAAPAKDTLMAVLLWSLFD